MVEVVGAVVVVTISGSSSMIVVVDSSVVVVVVGGWRAQSTIECKIANVNLNFAKFLLPKSYL